jgi:hypothetical protein
MPSSPISSASPPQLLPTSTVAVARVQHHQQQQDLPTPSTKDHSIIFLLADFDLERAARLGARRGTPKQPLSYHVEQRRSAMPKRKEICV